MDCQATKYTHHGITLCNAVITLKSSSFHRYGERGIKVCDEWLSVTGFYNDMGEKPAGSKLRRIDTDGDFEPGNCIWLSK